MGRCEQRFRKQSVLQQTNWYNYFSTAEKRAERKIALKPYPLNIAIQLLVKIYI